MSNNPGMVAVSEDTVELQEGWGDFIEPQDRLRDDLDWMYGQGAFGYVSPYSTIEDRSDGKFLPIYRTEQDLALMRGSCRNIAAVDAHANGAIEALANYIFGAKGFKFKAQAATWQEPPHGLVEALQKVIDDFLDHNSFTGEMDREIHERSRTDGEAFVALEFENGRVLAEFIETDRVKQPAGPEGLYEWLDFKFGIDCLAFEPSWTFGILTRRNRTSTPIGYHVVNDSGGTDFEFYPADQMVHFKRGVPRNAKRGVSDFYPVLPDLRNEAKLSVNMATGAALQSAIPWIEEFPPGTTQAGVQALGNNRAESTVNRPVAGGGSRQFSRVRYAPGTILRPSPGRVYKPGPMGAERNAGFVEVAKYIMRRVGVRWNAPEYMISGDASNANFSSTLVAESPFVKARESDQEWYGGRCVNMLWKAAKIVFEKGGILARFGLTWSQVVTMLHIAHEAPAVASRDPMKLAQTSQINIAAGIKSRRTCQIEAGVDPEEEDRQGAKPPELPAATLPADPFAVGGPVAKASETVNDTKPTPVPAQAPAQDVADTALNGAQVASLLEIVNQVAAGQMPFASARATIQAAFPAMSDTQIDAIMAPLKTFKPPTDTPTDRRFLAKEGPAKAALESAMESVKTPEEAVAVLLNAWRNYP